MNRRREYMIPKAAAERYRSSLALMNGGRPGLTYRWCWTCGLRRVNPWQTDSHEHVRRLPCGCTTTEENP